MSKDIKELFDAASKGDLNEVQKFKKAPETQYKDKTGRTALLAAAHGKHKSVVEYLLNNKISTIEEVDNGKQNVVHYSIGNLELIKYLHKQYPKQFAQKNLSDLNVLHQTAHNGFIDTLDYLINNKIGGSLSDETHTGNTPLSQAISNRKFEMANHIIKKYKVTVESSKKCSRWNNCELMKYAAKGMEEVAWLLENGCYIDYRCEKGDNVGKSARQILEKIRESQDALPLLQAAETLITLSQTNSAKKSIDETLSLLGKAINGRTFSNGNTALHHAILHNNKLMVKALCEQGANIHLENHTNITPLQLAKDQKNPIFGALLTLQYAHELINAEEKISADNKTKVEENKKQIEANQKLLPKMVKYLLETMDRLPEEDKHLLYFSLGTLLSYRHNFVVFRPVHAYQYLNKVERLSSHYPKAQQLIAELFLGGHISVNPSNPTNAKDPKQGVNIIASGGQVNNENSARDLRLREEIRHLLQAESFDPTNNMLFGKLVGEYALGIEGSMKGIVGATGKNMETFLALGNRKYIEEIVLFLSYTV